MKPSHFYIYNSNNCERTDFLPMFEFSQAHKVKCGNCPLAAYGHPMVQTEKNEHEYEKLCTLQVIRAGLLKLETVFLDTSGCGQKPDDYYRARLKLGM